MQQGNAYALYGAMRLFFQNGGGACYVVSVGSYADDIDGDATAQRHRDADQGDRAHHPRHPRDHARSPAPTRCKVQQAMLMHCGAQMRNRFAVLDIFAGHLDRQDPKGDPVATFRNDVGINNLDYGAAYYPWVRTSIFQARNFTYENVSAKSRGRAHRPAEGAA